MTQNNWIIIIVHCYLFDLAKTVFFLIRIEFLVEGEDFIRGKNLDSIRSEYSSIFLVKNSLLFYWIIFHRIFRKIIRRFFKEDHKCIDVLDDEQSTNRIEVNNQHEFIDLFLIETNALCFSSI